MQTDFGLKKKIKIAIPIIVLIITFLFLIYNMVNEKYLKQKNFKSLNRQIVVFTKLSKIIHETQRERGLSVGYISNNATKFHTSLLDQYHHTDSVMRELKNYLSKEIIFNNSLIEHTLEELSEIKELRIKVKDLTISALEIRNRYTLINNNILQTIMNISKEFKTKKIRDDIIAYTNLLFYEENLGLERAVGTNILSRKVMEQDLINLFNTYIIKSSVYQNLFLSYASKNSKKYYYQIYDVVAAKNIRSMENIILTAKEKNIQSIEAQQWFEEMTLLINSLKIGDDYLSKKMLETTANESILSQEEYLKYIIFGIMIFVLFIMMIIMILEMQKSEKKLKTLIDSYIISSTTDLKGIIQSVSQAFSDISGYTQDELVGKAHNIVRHDDNPKEIYKDMWRTLKLNKIWQGEIKNKTKDGGYYWVTAIISPIFHNGKKIGYSSIRQDITDSKRIEELNSSLKDKIREEVAKSRQKDQQMIQQSRLAQMGEMISMIAHQWRQPLTAISATSSILHYSAKKNKLDKKLILDKTERINSYSQHLSDTINDFRDFFKRDKVKKETDLDTLVNDVLKILELSLKYQNIKLELSLNAPYIFESYPNEIKQVILNILKNAEDIILENNIENAIISIKTYESKETISLEIKDNGGGIDQDIIENVFDPYFSTKLKKDGTGLGLYMSKTIIQEHCGGELKVKSHDNFTIFIIELKKV